MARAERRELIKKIEAARGSRVICYLTSDRQNADAQITKDALGPFFESLRKIGPTAQIDLFLYTAGGDTLAAFGIARLLREFTTKVGLLVPSRCHSAGTLLALSADAVVMTAGATLSPIDPSIAGPLNPAVEVIPGQRQLVPLSVESVAGFKALVTNDWDIKGEEGLGAAFKILAERVHPLALGDVYRARQQIELLAKRLLGEHRTDEDNIKRIVQTLSRDLGSHDYPLSRREARQLLGPQLLAENQALEGLIYDLYRDFSQEMQLAQGFDQNIELRAARARGTVGPVQVDQQLVVVETSDSGDVAERKLLLQELQMVPGLPPQLAAQLAMGGLGVRGEIVHAGWRHYA